MEEQREKVVLRVEDAMRKMESPPLQAGDTLARALEIAESSPEEILLVRFPTGRWAGITKEDLHKLAANNPMDALVRELLPAPHLPVLHPHQLLDDVFPLI